MGAICLWHPPPPVPPGFLGQAPGLMRPSPPANPSGKPYSQQWAAAWSYLYSLATNIHNSGSFTFTPKPAPQNWVPSASWTADTAQGSRKDHPGGRAQGLSAALRERGCGAGRGQGWGREGSPQRACVPHRDVQAIWSNEHALAWHLGEDFRMDPVAWARNQCLAWEELEDQLPTFLEELPDCPCTLAQARADSGRFHVSPPAQTGTGSG